MENSKLLPAFQYYMLKTQYYWNTGRSLGVKVEIDIRFSVPIYNIIPTLKSLWLVYDRQFIPFFLSFFS